MVIYLHSNLPLLQMFIYTFNFIIFLLFTCYGRKKIVLYYFCFSIEVQMSHSIVYFPVLYRKVPQLYTYIQFLNYFFPLQFITGQRIQLYTLGLCSLSIPNVIVHVYSQYKTPSPSLPLSAYPWQPQFCSLCLCESISVLQIS